MYLISFVYAKKNNRHTKFALPKGVSIIVCAQNESQNLAKLLPALLTQVNSYNNENFPFEVVLVNDQSTDETLLIAQQFKKQYENLSIVTIDKEVNKNLPGKKFAVQQGIKNAQYSTLLHIDADCLPTSQFWMLYMTGLCCDPVKIVAGYGGITPENGWLNAFIRWETQHTWTQMMSYGKWSIPYMAVGRNMVVDKNWLSSIELPKGYKEIPSGDDDLLIHSLTSGKQYTAYFHSDAATLSDGAHSIKQWINQKQRHVSAGKYYKILPQILLITYGVTHAAFWLLFITLLFHPAYIMAAILIAFQRIGIMTSLTYDWNKRLNNKLKVREMILGDFLWMIYNFVLSPYIFLKNKKTWR